MATFLDYAANIAEIIAGLAIVFSVIKVWPAVSNLNRLAQGRGRNLEPALQQFGHDLDAFIRSQDLRQQSELREEQHLNQLENLAPEQVEKLADYVRGQKHKQPQVIKQLKSLSSIEQAVDAMLFCALESASVDLHLEIRSHEDKLVGALRFRRKGVYTTASRMDLNLYQAIISELRVRANLDATASSPQYGRLIIKQEDVTVTSRMTTGTAVQGDYASIQILDPSSAKLPFEALGFTPKHLTQLKEALNWSRGLLVYSGITGSGKTVSLYASLNSFNPEEKHIITLEDPIAVELPTITQLAAERESGLTMSRLFRSAISLDPDVMLIGEIRDEELAQMCQKGATTGHLVMTTLHSHNVIESLEILARLSPELEARNLFIMNQCLANVPCPECSEPAALTDADQIFIEEICTFNQRDPAKLGRKFVSAKGCSNCENGYSGRIGAYEMLVQPTRALHMARQGAGSKELWQQVTTEGYTNSSYDLLRKASAGLTTLDEVRRATPLPDLL